MLMILYIFFITLLFYLFIHLINPHLFSSCKEAVSYLRASISSFSVLFLSSAIFSWCRGDQNNPHSIQDVDTKWIFTGCYFCLIFYICHHHFSTRCVFVTLLDNEMMNCPQWFQNLFPEQQEPVWCPSGYMCRQDSFPI